MAKIRFVAHDGTVTEVEAEAGTTIMKTAVANGINGIVAECGGAMSCATCHVYFDDAWYEKLDTPHPMEKEMLEFVIQPRPTSRLSCQLKVREELDGIVVHLPESQY
jgi:2Fe-2S ferredoxin